jgi:D-galactarolactone cycloisomerase
LKVTAVNIYILRHDLDEPFGFSQGWYHARAAMLVRLTTDDGLVGWGESYGPPEPSAAIVRHLLAPLVLGVDPCDTLPLWERMYAATRDYGQKGFALHAISAVDIALWDLKGQALGVSVSRLLGGRFRERVQAYATGLYFRPRDAFSTDLAEEAAAYVDAGFTAVKLKVGYTPEIDAQHVRAVREAIGPTPQLMIDANHAYDAATAIRLGRRLESYDLRWFEEPVIPENIEGYVEVRRALPMPIAGGEAEFTHYGFRRLFSAGAVDIVQPDLTATGGFTECQRIAAQASAWGVRYLPHVWGSAVGLHANLQFIAALPPATASLFPLEPLFELDRTQNRFRDDLAAEPMCVNDGWIDIPDRPGLGLEVDEAVIERYLVDSAEIVMSNLPKNRSLSTPRRRDSSIPSE